MKLLGIKTSSTHVTHGGGGGGVFMVNGYLRHFFDEILQHREWPGEDDLYISFVG